jgi:hypothetical protein
MRTLPEHKRIVELKTSHALRNVRRVESLVLPSLVGDWHCADATAGKN